MEPLLNFKGMAGGGGGNATVPGSVPFLPVQAFVNNITIFANPRVEYDNSTTLTFTGITTISLSADPATPEVGKGDSVIFDAAATVDGSITLGTATFDFSACLLIAASVNGVLAALNFFSPVDPTKWTFNLGGTCAAPTGQGITDKATAIGRGFNVITN